MDDHNRAELFDEILRERLPSVRYLLDEWSVPHAEALTYAQAKDLIWQIAAPLGLTMLAFGAAERALHETPGDLDLVAARARFLETGEESGRLLEQLVAAAVDLAR